MRYFFDIEKLTHSELTEKKYVYAVEIVLIGKYGRSQLCQQQTRHLQENPTNIYTRKQFTDAKGCSFYPTKHVAAKKEFFWKMT